MAGSVGFVAMEVTTLYSRTPRYEEDPPILLQSLLGRPLTLSFGKSTYHAFNGSHTHTAGSSPWMHHITTGIIHRDEAMRGPPRNESIHYRRGIYIRI